MSEDPNIMYNLTIEGAGLSFSREIGEAVAGRLMGIVLSGSGSTEDVAVKDLSKLPNSISQPRRLSLREFLAIKGAKHYPDKIVTIAKYLDLHENRATFSKEEIKSRFRSAGEAPPGNFPRDFNSALTSGWIAEDSSAKGRFYVTVTGDEALEEGFTGVPTLAKRRLSRKRRGAAFSYQSA